MKLAHVKIITPGTQPHTLPDTPPAPNQGGGFFALMVKAAGYTRKELAYDLRWSDTYIDGIMNGEKNNPVEQARKFCKGLRQRNRMDLVVATIVHIAGGDDFDGRVLTAEQYKALYATALVLKELAEGVKA